MKKIKINYNYKSARKLQCPILLSNISVSLTHIFRCPHWLCICINLLIVSSKDGSTPSCLYLLIKKINYKDKSVSNARFCRLHNNTCFMFFWVGM